LSMILQNLIMMAQDIEKLIKSKFKSIKNDGLGHSKTFTLQIGDIVAWDSWSEMLDTNVFEEKNGILIDILFESRTSGQGYVAKILPFGSNLPILLPLIIVRKSKLRN